MIHNNDNKKPMSRKSVFGVGYIKQYAWATYSSLDNNNNNNNNNNNINNDNFKPTVTMKTNCQQYHICLHTSII